jgi:hypothetical protein
MRLSTFSATVQMSGEAANVEPWSPVLIASFTHFLRASTTW